MNNTDYGDGPAPGRMPLYVPEGGRKGDVVTRLDDEGYFYDWRPGGGAAGAPPFTQVEADLLYVKKLGDAMTGGDLTLFQDPTLPMHATNKFWVETAIANAMLNQGAWQVASNVPDLIAAIPTNLNGFTWTAQTVDPNVAEACPANIPGIVAGTLIAAGDTIRWNATLALYEHIQVASANYGIGLEEAGGVVNLQAANVKGIGGVTLLGRGPLQGLEYDIATGLLTAPLATNVAAGSIVEPPPDGLSYVRSRSLLGVSTWLPTAAGLDFGIGLTQTGNVVDLQVASAAELGGVKIVARSINQGLDLDGNGFLTAPLATNQHAGTIVEPPNDGLQYVRTRSLTGNSSWVAAASGLTFGIGLDQTGTTVDLQPATVGGELGGVKLTARDLNQGLAVDSQGFLSAPLATNQHAGSIVDPPNDGLQYARSRSIAGVSSWQAVTAGSSVTIADAPPANPKQGDQWWRSDRGDMYLWFDDGTSAQWVATAPGAAQNAGINEAPVDGAQYVRRDAVWQTMRGLAAVGDAAPANPVQGQLWWSSTTGKLCIWFDDGTSAQWVET